MNFSAVLNNVLADAFEKAGYDRSYGKVSVSNRPDLCEYQCNGAMAGAKKYTPVSSPASMAPRMFSR